MQPNRQRDIANIAMLSGDQQLAQFGKVILTDQQRKEVLAQRDTEFKARQNTPVHMGSGFMYSPETGEATQDPNFAAYQDKQHNQRLEFAAAQNAGRQSNITASERAKLADMDSKLQLGRDAMAALDANPETKEKYADTATNVVKGIWPDMGNLVESSHKSDAELDTLNKMRRYIAAIRKSELGSALTGYELVKGGEWDPTAGGIDGAEAKRRMSNLVEYMDREYELFRAGRPMSHEQEAGAGDVAPTSSAPAPDQVWVIGPDGTPVRQR